MSFPTSYIKTEGSQVTRVADSASITGENFSEWYRQDEGTVFVEATDGKDVTGGYGRLIQIRSNADNRIDIFGDNPSFRIEYNGNGSVTGNNVVFDFSLTHSMAFGISNSGSASAVNGQITGGLGNFPLPNVDQIGIGQLPETSVRVNACIKRLTYYPKRLPNAVLQTLTEE